MSGLPVKRKPAAPGEVGGLSENELGRLEDADNSEPCGLSQEADDGRDFDWSSRDDSDSIVVDEQAPIAVYLNPKGAIILRTRCWPDDDSWLAIAPEHVAKVARAMLDAAGLSLSTVLHENGGRQ